MSHAGNFGEMTKMVYLENLKLILMKHNDKLDKLQRNLYYDKMTQNGRVREVGSFFDSMIKNIDNLLEILKKMDETNKLKQ